MSFFFGIFGFTKIQQFAENFIASHKKESLVRFTTDQTQLNEKKIIKQNP